MSILIRGMDMPKQGCDHCFLRTGNYCSRIADESVVEYAIKEERHPNCPLVELPKRHGRLIDSDAFETRIKELYCSDCDRRKGVKKGKMRMLYEIGDAPCRACGTYDALSDIDDAPTVIEAEE